MKKKIVNVFLIAALFVVAVGTFVSCKDNEDDYLNLQSQFDDQIEELWTALNDAIEEQTKALEDAKDSLSEVTVELQSQIDELNDEIDDLEIEIDALEEDIDAKIEAINQCECSDVASATELATLKSQLEALESDLASKYAELLALITELSETTSSKTSVEEALAEIEETLAEYEASISTLSTEVSANTDSIASLFEQLTALQETAATVEALTDLEVRVELLESDVAGLRDSLIILWAQVYQDSAYIAELQENYKDLEQRFETDSANVWSTLSAHSDSLADLADRCDTLSDYINEQLTKVYSYIDTEIDELSETLSAAIAEGDSTTLADAQAYTDSIESLLQEQIDSLCSVVSDLAEQVAANTAAIDELTDRVDAIEEELLARYVTSIIVQGTENDCFGTFALPLGIRSNILMGYYGYWNSDGTFPTTSNGYNVDDNSYLDDNILAILVEAGLSVEEYTDADVLGLNEDNNIDAGTLYLTVNPTSVDFEDLSVSLENSKGVESGVLLEDLEESDALLTFGYTRSSDNGFYETKAYIPYDNISDVKVNVESGLKSELTSALKSAISGGNISFSGLIGTIYDQFNGILPALAVKTAWTDEDDGTEYSVYSEYSVAATTFQPLSFKFLQSTSYSIPTISTLSYIDLGDFDEINIELDYTPVEYTYEEQTISISFSEITIDIETDSIGLVYEHPLTSEDEDGNRYYQITDDGTIAAVEDTLWFHTDSLTEDLEEAILEMLADMEDEINEQLNTTINELMESIVDDIIAQINSTISEMIENINTQLDGINDLIDSFNGIQETLDNYIDLVNTYISRINTVINRINSYLTNVNHYLQVAMLYEGEDGGLGLLGNSKSLYYVSMEAGSSAVLHPTTYTAELVVPCAKKFVAVTNVYSGATDDEGALADSSLKELMIEANQSSDYINTVLDGNTRAIEFTIPSGAESGQIFEITYAAVDYHGYTSYNKYYIGVK